jgi:hypothetical protein
LANAAEVELVSSAVLEYENSLNPFPMRTRWVNRCLAAAKHYQALNESIRERARHLEHTHIAAIDALHLACAEASASEYFLTCDDRLIRRYRGDLKTLNPVDFVMAMSGGE